MPHLSVTLSETVARRHGVVTAAELVADGLGPSAVRRWVTNGALVRCHDGVYRVATAPDTFASRCVAVCLAEPNAVVTGPAAARLWEFRHVYRPDQPTVLVEHDRNPLSGPVIVRRTNVLDEEDRVVRADGITVASPARSWFDCATALNDERFEMLTEWVLDRHASIPDLWRTRRRLAARGRPGLARVNRVLSQRATWQRPAGSGLEHRVLRALERSGVRHIVRQHPIRLYNGVVIHPDGALPAIKWAVEIDHVTWHGGRIDAQRDKARDRALRRVGWQVDRVTDVEVNTRFDATIRELLDLIAVRRHDLAA
jgi:very-short-patch-repair endonuclease